MAGFEEATKVVKGLVDGTVCCNTISNQLANLHLLMSLRSS